MTTEIPTAFPWTHEGITCTGMSLRDYFAASFITSGTVFKNLSSGSTTDEVAAQAYALADAMLKARQA